MSSQSTFNSKPIRLRPLRNPGQSLDEEIDRLVSDNFLGVFLFAAIFWILAGVEFLARTLAIQRMPGTYALGAAAFTALAVYRFFAVRRRVGNLKLGRDGEREVADLLDALKGEGAQVIHDIPANNFNIDHVVISTRGIYAIETKTLNKPTPKSRIEFDGACVRISGFPTKFDPLDQCRAQAVWVRNLLKISTTKDFTVRGVVVFPTWWVEQLPGSEDSDVWVENPKALVKWISRAPKIWDESDTAMAALHLRQYVRSRSSAGSG